MIFENERGVLLMPKQPAIPGLRDALKKKLTRREKFLTEIDEVVPRVRSEPPKPPSSRNVGAAEAVAQTLQN